MYKLLSVVLTALFVVAGGFYLFERSSHASSRQQLSNKIAELEGVVKETETAYSRRGVEIEDLEAANKELQEKIEDRDEEIVAIGDIAVKWKDKYFEIKNGQGANETVVNNNGESTNIGEACKEELKNKRFKVEFSQDKDYLNISGYTLTNPPYAYIGLKWTRDLKLNLVLTKKDKDFRIYVDSDTSDIVPTDIKLSVDSSVLGRKWYEKIGGSTSIGIYHGLLGSISLFYDITDNMFIGPYGAFVWDGQRFLQYYGATFGMYFFRW